MWDLPTECQTGELTLRTQSFCDREPSTWIQWSESRPQRFRPAPRFPPTVGLLTGVNVAQIEIYLHIVRLLATGEFLCSQSDNGFRFPAESLMRVYTYSIIRSSSMPYLKMIRTKQPGNSHKFRTSEDANEEVIDETSGGKQGHLPVPMMVKVTWETTFRDTLVGQSMITYDDDRGVDLFAHWLENQILSWNAVQYHSRR